MRITLDQLDATISGKNKIINGNFDFWQRGSGPITGITNTRQYKTADRWCTGNDGTGTFTQSKLGLGLDSISGASYALSIAHTGGTGGTYKSLSHYIEDVTLLSGKTVTLSFYAKADSNRTITVSYRQDFGNGTGATSYITTTPQSITLTTTWEKHTVTTNIPSISGKTFGDARSNDCTGLFFGLPLNTADSYQFAQVQLEEGSVATNFSLAGGTYAGELALCQRYCCVAPAMSIYQTGWVSTAGASAGLIQFTYPVQMRIAPNNITYKTSWTLTQATSPTIANTNSINCSWVINGTTNNGTVQAYLNGITIFEAEL